MREWFWWQVYKLIGYMQSVTIRLRLYAVTFWLSGLAFHVLDLWDGGYPEYKEEDWDE